MNLTITCMYTCNACGVKDLPVEVPAREEEDVVKWVEAAAALMGADHGEHSPDCPSRTIDLKIPVTGADKVGGPPRN